MSPDTWIWIFDAPPNLLPIAER